MAGNMATETPTRRDLMVAREPVGPKRTTDKGTMGDQALMDALKLIIICWLILGLLSFSLRRHIV